MKTVVIDGVTYTKVSELARAHQYTADYLGQLCRAGKIEAELVGRAWYASEASLLDHKAGRYTVSGESEITNNTKLKVHSSDRKTAIPVHPRLSKKTQKAIASVPAPAPKQFYRHQRIDQSLYIPDDTELVPQPRVQRMEATDKPSTSFKIKVNPAQSEKVKVKNTSERRDFSFTRVPTVALRGDLKIADLDEEDARTDFLVSETDLYASVPRKRIRPTVPGTKRLDVQPLKSTEVISSLDSNEEEVVSPAPVTNNAITFTPAQVKVGRVRRSYLVPLTFIGTLVLVMMLFGVDTVLVTDGVSITENFAFSTASIVTIFSHFSQFLSTLF